MTASRSSRARTRARPARSSLSTPAPKRESQGADGRRIEGGIISSEAPIHVSNVQLVTKVKDENGKDKEVVTRVGYERVDVTKRRSDGSTYQAQRSVRIASKTGKEI